MLFGILRSAWIWSFISVQLVIRNTNCDVFPLDTLIKKVLDANKLLAVTYVSLFQTLAVLLSEMGSAQERLVKKQQAVHCGLT